MRPLVAHLSDSELKLFIAESLGQRAPFYEKAQLIFDADNAKNAELEEMLN